MDQIPKVVTKRSMLITADPAHLEEIRKFLAQRSINAEVSFYEPPIKRLKLGSKIVDEEANNDISGVNIEMEVSLEITFIKKTYRLSLIT